jgi:hypothetical protein
MRPLAVMAAGVALATVATAASALVLATSWKGKVTGRGDSKITGDAAITPSADGTGAEVNVMIMGDTPGATRPWHIHIGSCAAPGGVLGGGRSYTPITIDGSGHGMSKATLPVAVPDSGSYYVNIHESAGNMGSIVACGDLTKQ